MLGSGGSIGEGEWIGGGVEGGDRRGGTYGVSVMRINSEAKGGRREEGIVGVHGATAFLPIVVAEGCEDLEVSPLPRDGIAPSYRGSMSLR